MNVEISGYLLTWNTATRAQDRSGQPVWTRWKRENSADRLLAQDPASLRFQVNHAGPDVGGWHRFTVDEVGLIGHGHVSDAQVVKDIRAGKLTGLSVHAEPGWTYETGETRDGEPVVDLDDAELREAGPVDSPADLFARILTLGGEPVDAGAGLDGLSRMDEVLAELESITGVRSEDVLAEIRRRPAEAKATVEFAESLARRLAKARGKADSSYRWWLHHGRDARDWQDFRDADDLGEQLYAALDEAICHDPAIYRQLAARYRIPPRLSLTARMRAGMASAGRRAA